MQKLLAGIFLVLIILTIPVFAAFAQAPKVPVVILFEEKPTDKHANLVKSNSGEITRTYNIINGLAANIPQDKIENLKSNPLVISVDLDVEVKAFDINADNQIRANQVWAAGDTGQGVPVAILDTGIDNTHPEFSGRILKCHSEIFNANTCNDENGHGTHVAGIAGASGVLIDAKGVAPAVSFDIDQVLDATGSGTISGLIAGIQWSVANGAKVISMSLGTNPISTTQPNCDTTLPSLTTAINNAVSAGVTVVAAAGNSGNAGVGAPACISSTIAIGAVNSADTIASFSSRGGPVKDHGIVAPGVNIFSTLPGGYGTLSGTSMATPMVSGTVALLLKANPSLTPTSPTNQPIRSTLFSTACTSSTTPSCPTGSVPNTVYGYGRVDALRAYNAVATPAPPPSPTVPSAPQNLVATAGNAQIKLSWSAPLSDGGSLITNYKIYRGTVSGAETLLTTVGNVLAYTDTAVTNGQTYYYQVTAVNSVGESARSNEASATPSAPPTTTLSVAVTTDKTSYAQKSWAFITVTVTANATPISGASVTVTVQNPNGGIAQGSGITNSNGQVIFKYRIGPNAPLGTYTATAQASATGFNPGTGSTTFTVK